MDVGLAGRGTKATRGSLDVAVLEVCVTLLLGKELKVRDPWKQEGRWLVRPGSGRPEAVSRAFCMSLGC